MNFVEFRIRKVVSMAEKEGFEPSVPCGTAVFKTVNILDVFRVLRSKKATDSESSVAKTGEKRGNKLQGRIR